MVIKEYLLTREDGVKLFKFYSIDKFYICRVETGEIGKYLIDEENTIYTYKETNVKREYLLTRKDEVKLYKSYSIEGFYIRKVGTEEVYAEAVDVEDAPFTYEETEEKIEDIKEEKINE